MCIIPSLSAGKPQKHCTYQEKICKKHYKTPRRPGELLATTTVRTPSVSTTNRNKSSMQIRSDASWIKLLISQETVTNQACELQCNPGTRLRKLSVFTTTAPSALSLARPNHQTIKPTNLEDGYELRGYKCWSSIISISRVSAGKMQIVWCTVNYSVFATCM